MVSIDLKTNPSDMYENVQFAEKQLDLDTGLCYFKFKIFHDVGVAPSEKILLRSEAYKNTEILLDYGAHIKRNSDYYDYLREEELRIDFKYIHKTLGWCRLDEQDVFKCFKAYPIDSEYQGYFNVKPCGSYKAWLNGVKDYAMKTTALQLAVVLGLSAVTVGFLREYLDLSLFVHLYGASSTGKSSFAQLALSTAANPNPSANNSLFATYADTQNYLVSMLSNNFGVPVVFDELSIVSYRKDLSDFIYKLANGRDKGRLNTKAEKREVATWATTIISTGESSILAQTNNNAGLSARVLELSPDIITPSAKDAEELREIIFRNYGHANMKFAKYLIRHKDLVVDLFENFREKFIKVSFLGSLAHRLSKNLSIIMTTAVLCGNIFGLDFDIHAIGDLLLNSLAKQNERNSFSFDIKVSDFLLSDLISNSRRYKIQDKYDDVIYSGNNIIGVVKELKVPTKINKQDCHIEMYYLPEKFAELLANGGFSDEKVVIDCLANRGYLLREGNHSRVKRNIDGVRARVYVVRFPDSMLDRKIIDRFKIY